MSIFSKLVGTVYSRRAIREEYFLMPQGPARAMWLRQHNIKNEEELNRLADKEDEDSALPSRAAAKKLRDQADALLVKASKAESLDREEERKRRSLIILLDQLRGKREHLTARRDGFPDFDKKATGLIVQMLCAKEGDFVALKQLSITLDELLVERTVIELLPIALEKLQAEISAAESELAKLH